MSKERDSNIELLRIVAMLMIVLHHLCQLSYPDFPGTDWSVELLKNLMATGGKIGVDLFVLISGYFLASGKVKFTSFLRVLLEAWFYSFTIGLLCGVFAPSIFDMKLFLKSFLPANGGLPWFVTVYLGMYLVAPWLSRLASGLDKATFKQMLLVGFIVFSVIPTITRCMFVFSEFAWFCFLFLVACYIRRFGLGKVTAQRLLAGGGFLLVASVIVLDLLSFWLPSLHEKVLYFASDYSVLTFAISIGLFCVFKDLKVGHLKWVNLLAQGAFGVYLIHVNVFLRQIFWPRFDFVFTSGAALVVPLAILVTVGVFLLLAVLDLVRLNVLEKPLFTLLVRKCGKLFERCDWILNGRGDRGIADQVQR